MGKKDFAGPCKALEFSLSDPRSHAEFLTGLDMMGHRLPLAVLWKIDSQEHNRKKAIPFSELLPPPHRSTLAGTFLGRTPCRTALVLFLLL